MDREAERARGRRYAALRRQRNQRPWAERYPRPRPSPPLVYFISDGMGNVKIGVAYDPVGRRATLQCGNAHELTLLAALPGTEELEAELHVRFAPYWVRGEWFKLVPEIEDFIERSAP